MLYAIKRNLFNVTTTHRKEGFDKEIDGWQSLKILLLRPPAAHGAMANRPLVSVVTPFFNTAPYLAECIESVLAQSYSQFEYILMDNCSTDGSSEIAATYASRDSRIRLIRCSQFLPQLANYNRALAEISDASTYCKIVQADDYIFPECLQLMVRAFEQSESIGLVSSYWLDGNELWGSGLPRQTTMLPGKECGRRFLRTGTSLFGHANSGDVPILPGAAP